MRWVLGMLLVVAAACSSTDDNRTDLADDASYLHDGDVSEPVDVVLYMHGAGGGNGDFGEEKWEPVRDMLLDGGWLIIEAEACGRHWGSECGRDAYRDAYEQVADRFDIDRLVILGRSMGGLTAAYAAAEDPTIASEVDGVVFASAVLDPDAIAEDVPRVAEEIPADTWRPLDHDWPDIPTLATYGTEDGTAPAERHALAFAALHDIDTVDLGELDHLETWDISDPLADFLADL